MKNIEHQVTEKNEMLIVEGNFTIKNLNTKECGSIVCKCYGYIKKADSYEELDFDIMDLYFIDDILLIDDKEESLSNIESTVRQEIIDEAKKISKLYYFTYYENKSNKI